MFGTINKFFDRSIAKMPGGEPTGGNGGGVTKKIEVKVLDENEKQMPQAISDQLDHLKNKYLNNLKESDYIPVKFDQIELISFKSTLRDLGMEVNDEIDLKGMIDEANNEIKEAWKNKLNKQKVNKQQDLRKGMVEKTQEKEQDFFNIAEKGFKSAEKEVEDKVDEQSFEQNALDGFHIEPQPQPEPEPEPEINLGNSDSLVEREKGKDLFIELPENVIKEFEKSAEAIWNFYGNNLTDYLSQFSTEAKKNQFIKMLVDPVLSEIVDEKKEFLDKYGFSLSDKDAFIEFILEKLKNRK